MTEESRKAPRQSGVELLRIIAIMMVVTVHYLGKGILYTVPFGSLNTILARGIESLSIVYINVFILITGYFNVKSPGFNLRRIVDLLLMVAFYGGAFYCYYSLTGVYHFQLTAFLKSLVPYLFEGFWFIRVYLILMLIAPFLNVMLNHLKKSAYLTLVVFCLILFSLLPSFLPTFKSNGGYDILHFVVIYIISGYFRLHLKKLPPAWLCFCLYCLFAFITFLFSVYGDNLGYWTYDFISVIPEACFLFLTFLQLRFVSRPINYIARSTLAVFVLENCIYQLYDRILHVSDYKESPYFIVHFAASVIAFSTLALATDCLRRGLFRLSVDRILNRSRLLNQRYLSNIDQSKDN